MTRASSGSPDPAPGAGNDALRALQSLPGVARTPFGLGGLALRGTAPHDTKVYLDGIEVPLLYHFGGIASFVPTGAVDEVTLEPGRRERALWPRARQRRDRHLAHRARRRLAGRQRAQPDQRGCAR
ncbi:MAG TPA: Plug domain-containing protein [Kofleriaceae bacterium]|nr:Plug domain-containing protein [Kofleriaceae bacterium]